MCLQCEQRVLRHLDTLHSFVTELLKLECINTSCKLQGRLYATIGLHSYKFITLCFEEFFKSPQYWLIVLPMFGKDGLNVQTKGIISESLLVTDLRASSLERLAPPWRLLCQSAPLDNFCL